MNMLNAFGASQLSQANRPIRVRLSHHGGMLDDVLQVKHLDGCESLCGGFEYRLFCVSTNASLPLKELIALPIELQFVTDRGQLRAVCGIVAEVSAGQSDGGLGTYQLIMRDALALMERRINTRVFRNVNEIDITISLVREWHSANSILARTFDLDVSAITGSYAAREFRMQHNESDTAFLRRLWKQQGIAWFFRPGRRGQSGRAEEFCHTLVLFDTPHTLSSNTSGTVRFHRDAGTEVRDGIFNWSAARSLSVGSITRQSWDYRQGRMMFASRSTNMQQGDAGSRFAAGLDDYQVDAPHFGDDGDDYRRLGELRIQRHEYEAKCFRGESGVRDFSVGEWFRLDGHPDIDSHPDDE